MGYCVEFDNTAQVCQCMENEKGIKHFIYDKNLKKRRIFMILSYKVITKKLKNSLDKQIGNVYNVT